MNFYQNLFSDRRQIPLDLVVDVNQFEKELASLNMWRPYNPRKANYNRWGMSLTSLDGGSSGVPDLDSLKEYNKIQGTQFSEMMFKVKTQALEHLRSLHSIFQCFESCIGRSHLILLKQGGYFPPHVDNVVDFDRSFRIFVPLLLCNWPNLIFHMGEGVLRFEIGRAYLLDTSVEHSVFSFAPFTVFMVMNLAVDQRTYETLCFRIQSKNWKSL